MGRNRFRSKLWTTDEVPDVHDYFAFELSLDRIKIWTGDGVASDVPMGAAASLLSDPNIRKVTHDVKAALLRLRRHDVTLAGPVDDSMLMGYLLMPNRGKYGIDDLAKELFGQPSEGEAVAWIHRIYEELRPRVLQEVESVYTTIEMPLVPVLADMEKLGIPAERVGTGNDVDGNGPAIGRSDGQDLRTGRHGNSTSTRPNNSVKFCLKNSTCHTLANYVSPGSIPLLLKFWKIWPKFTRCPDCYWTTGS